MAEQWLIDGYNLLHALQSKAPKNTAFSREHLFAQVAEFASLKKTPILIVLDGVGDEGELRAYRTTYFEVVFSQSVSADTCIEKYLFDHRQTKSLVVVTDDRAISNMGRGGGARVLSTSIFSELLKECKKEASDVLHKEKSREHGFHRPFEDKLKDL